MGVIIAYGTLNPRPEAPASEKSHKDSHVAVVCRHGGTRFGRTVTKSAAVYGLRHCPSFQPQLGHRGRKVSDFESLGCRVSNHGLVFGRRVFRSLSLPLEPHVPVLNPELEPCAVGFMPQSKSQAWDWTP